MAQRAARDELSFRILVVRSGGIAGLRRQWQVEPRGDAESWLELVRACPWGAVNSDPASRDRFVWRIEARMPHPVRIASVPDAQLVGPWRALVDRVLEVGTDG